MEIGHIIPHIEALVFASDKPLTPIDITELINNAFGFMEDKITMEQVQTAMDGIVEKYQADFYPFEMKESGGGWQFLTKKDYHKTVAQLNQEKYLKRLSAAALETLAIIAYKQPITKADIESIRGVNCDYSIQKLLEKELIVITGRNEELPGKPLIYNTSRTFMDYFGINSPSDLPKLKEIFNDAMVDPTVMGASDDSAEIADQVEVDMSANGIGHTELDEEATAISEFVVTENGELLEEAGREEEEGGDEEMLGDEDEDIDDDSEELIELDDIEIEEDIVEEELVEGEENTVENSDDEIELDDIEVQEDVIIEDTEPEREDADDHIGHDDDEEDEIDEGEEPRKPE